MKKLLFFASLLLILSLLALAQNEQNPTTDELMMQRQESYQAYMDARASMDTTQALLVNFAQKTDPLIQIDDILIEQYLQSQMDSIRDLKSRLDAAEQKNVDEDATQSLAEIGHTIAFIAGGFMFVLMLLFIILYAVKSGRVKKMKKLYSSKDTLIAEKEAQIAEKDEKISGLEKSLNEQGAQFKKDTDALRASAEQERRNLKMKEDDLSRKVTEIEDKVKKSSEKESDLNYQIFQLELRLKNELEGTVKEKCELENKVIELERELSEAKLALNQEMNRPHMSDDERSEMLGKISWLENEAPYLRQCIDNEKTAKENAENALRDRQQELENLYRERDGLWGRINELEGQLNEKNNLVNDLQWLQNEKNQLLEQLKQSEYNEEAVNNFRTRIDELEKQLDVLRPRAEEASRLREQLEELLKVIDRFRPGN